MHQQGSAVFWYNLHPNGDGDYRTRHAACPVLLGNKWGEFCLIGTLFCPIMLALFLNELIPKNCIEVFDVRNMCYCGTPIINL